MRILKIMVAPALFLALAGCFETDSERALLGAGIGALAADAMGENVIAGAAIGGTAGALCNDAGVCN